MNKRGTAVIGIILIAIGAILLLNVLGFIPGSPLETLTPYWPFILIISGILYLTNQRVLGTLALILTILVVINYGVGQILPDVGNERTFTQTVPATMNPELVELTINYGFGDLSIGAGDEEHLYTSTVTTNLEEDPVLTSEVEEETVRIQVNQPRYGWRWKTTNEWDVELRPNTPYTLDLNYGAINTNISLEKLTIQTLSIDSGASDVTLTLEEYPTIVDISSGASDIELIIPKNYPVIIDIDGGAIDVEAPDTYEEEENVYTNEAYNEEESYLNISINAGASDITIKEK